MGREECEGQSPHPGGNIISMSGRTVIVRELFVANIGTLSWDFYYLFLLALMVAVTLKLSERTLNLSSVTGEERQCTTLLHHLTAHSKCQAVAAGWVRNISFTFRLHFTSVHLSSVLFLRRPDVLPLLPSPPISSDWRNLN